MHGLNQWLAGSKQQRTNGTAVITGLIWEAPYRGSYVQPSYIIKLIFIYFLTMHMQVVLCKKRQIQEVVRHVRYQYWMHTVNE